MLARWLAQEGRDTRAAVSAAMKTVAGKITAMRAEVVRSLVDDEGWTITAAARTLSVSRQMAARLYKLGQEQFRADASR